MRTQIVSTKGYKASYHDLARQYYFEDDTQLLPRDTFQEVFADVTAQRADYALVAIENSLYGSINAVYDLLLSAGLWIRGEIYLRIHHCLLGLPGAQLDQISEVHSDPVALAQCEAFLDEKLPQARRFERPDTAASAADIARWQDPQKTAIASRQAAELHGLAIVAHEIETNTQNYTRFLILQRKRSSTQNASKTSIIMQTDHTPGALYKALGTFVDHNINLSKLESRPIIGKAWHYIFYIDFEAGLHERSSKQALRALEALGYGVTILGSYIKGQIIS